MNMVTPKNAFVSTRANFYKKGLGDLKCWRVNAILIIKKYPDTLNVRNVSNYVKIK